MKSKNNIKMRQSLAMNLEQYSPGVGGRHRRTFTYGFGGNRKNLYMALSNRDALAFDIWDTRRILIEDGLYNKETRKILREYIEMSKNVFPDIFKK
ncbi:hypothetical protein [Tepidibacter mesophilus]|uniref:hypothetical protein n=1 Tax=Tepidibacter mesophilus TaxID=655607 RepID=UPI001A9A5F41|nr:hypothetical protein [Tepidibacter mesophilus]